MDGEERVIQTPFGRIVYSLGHQSARPEMMLDYNALMDVHERFNQPRGLEPQLLESLPEYQFQKAKSQNMSGEHKSCMICMEEFEDGENIRLLPCLHRFHRDCIDKWLNTSTTCPVCKKDIVDSLRGDGMSNY